MAIDYSEYVNRYGSLSGANRFANSGNSVKVSADFSDVFSQLDSIVADAGRFTREVAQAGADVLYNEVRNRAGAMSSKKEHWFHGTNKKYLFQPGTLRDSIYQVYSKDNSITDQKATYHVSWNHKKCPYGYMVEYGTTRAAAHSFVRSSYEAMGDLSITVAKDRFIDLMEDALK